MEPHVLHNIIHQYHGNNSERCPVCNGEISMSNSTKLEECANQIMKHRQTSGYMYSETGEKKTSGITVTAGENVILRTSYQFDDEVTEMPSEIMLVPLGEWDTTKYGIVKVTADDIETMKANFDANIRKGVMIDVDHGQSQYGAAAAGWIKKVECRDTGLWATEIEWTKLGDELVKSKIYKFLSPEFDVVYVDPQDSNKVLDNVLIATSLVNRPLLKEIPSLTFSEGKNLTEKKNGVILVVEQKTESSSTSQTGPTNMLTFSEVLKKITAGETLTEEEKAVAVENQSQLSEEQKQAIGIKASENAPDDKHISGKEENVTISASELAELREGKKRIEALEHQALQREIKEEYKKYEFSEKGGKFAPALTDKVAEFASKLTPNQRVQFTEILEGLPEVGAKLFNEQGSDKDTTENQQYDALKAEVTEYAEKHNLKFGEALKVMQTKDPKKFAEYRVSKGGSTVA